MRDAEPEKKIEISEADPRGQGRKPEAARVSGSNFPGDEEQTDPKQPDLIERMLERGNLLKAWQAVEANRGAAGIDGMEVEQLRSYLRAHRAQIKEQIRNGSYEPRPVRRVDIPEPGGGTRMLPPGARGSPGAASVTSRVPATYSLALSRKSVRPYTGGMMNDAASLGLPARSARHGLNWHVA